MGLTIKFWGTRGSLPAPLTAAHVRAKVLRALEAVRGHTLPSSPVELEALADQLLPFHNRATFGGNTACVQVKTANPDYVLLDAGTGLRDFAHALRMEHARGSKPAFPAASTFHLFLSHLHWDHVQGLPFFYPLYVPGQRVIIYSGHPAVEAAVRQQFSAPGFPVPYEQLRADIQYRLVASGEELAVADLRVNVLAQNHPGGSFGYRLGQAGRVCVYSTDNEHKQLAMLEPDYPFVKFIADADLLIFDAMYSLADATFAKADWGHSSNVTGVELAARGRVRRLALFHHDPHVDDAELAEVLINTRMYVELFHREPSHVLPGPETFPTEVLLAYDGLELPL